MRQYGGEGGIRTQNLFQVLENKGRTRISNIFIFLSAVYYVYPFSLVSPVLAQNRHQIDTKLAERVNPRTHVPL